MDQSKQKSIKAIGIIVSVFSGLLIFSNLMGIIVWTVFGIGEAQKDVDFETGFIKLNLATDFVRFCIIIISLAIPYLIGGLFIIRRKLWAKVLVSVLSVIFFVLVWGVILTIMLSSGVSGNAFGYGALVVAVFWSAPFGVIIWLLTRKNTKSHFS